ncbi:MAG: hypothetical protein GY854_24465 [Deltaproteobacteria bacterium]|nr:hypothetical protein [Deltaproteobacteria bacterium]
MNRRQNITLLATTAIVCCVCALATSCDPVDGADPYAIWNTFEQSDDFYHFHYLSPPWEPTSLVIPTRQVFVVDPSTDPLPEIGLAGDGLSARLEFVVEMVFGIDAQAEAQARLDRWKNAGAETKRIESFVSEGGDEGFRTWARSTDRWITAVYLYHPMDGVVIMTVVGKENVDTQDITLLMKSLEPRPAEGD